MGKKKVSVLEPAADAVADIALFIEGKRIPETAKKFIDEAFLSLPAWDESISGITAKANKKNIKIITPMIFVIYVLQGIAHNTIKIFRAN
jgi:hypothetical protein